MDVDADIKKLNKLFDNIEINLKNCKIKYKTKNDVDNLYTNLTNILLNENFNEANLNEELAYIETALNQENKLNETYKKQLNDLKDRLKHLNIEIKSIKTMLEKCLNSWTKFNESFDLIEKWLNEKENKLNLNKDDLIEYQTNQKYHVQLNEMANFLLQVSEKEICTMLKERLLYVNKRWKNIQEMLLKNNKSSEHLIKLIECGQGSSNINDWLNKIDNLVLKNLKCSNVNTIIKYQEELNKANNDLESIDANIILLNKLITKIHNEFKSGELQAVNEEESEIISETDICKLIDDIKNLDEKLNNLRHVIPDYLKNLTKFCTHLTSIDDAVKQTEHWVSEGESLLKSQPDQLNFEQITKHIDKQKKHFSEYNYYDSIVNDKIELLGSYSQLIPPNFDYSEVTMKIERIKELLHALNEKSNQWEGSFKRHQTSWKIFYVKTKQLEEWIMNAQTIVSEINDDLNYLIQKHKQFFDHVDSEILHGFLNAGNDLLHIKNEADKVEIKTLMDTLEGKWMTILSHAPIRLLKLNFKRLEQLLRQEINAADEEIMEESLALNQNKDINEILKRHEAKFKYSDFFATCESYLQGLRSCTKQLIEQKVEDKSNIEDVLDHLQKYWENLTQKIELMNAKLKTLPETKEQFDKNLHYINSWINDVEQNKRQISSNDLTVSEYKRLIEKLKGSIKDVDEKRQIMKNLQSQFNYLNSELVLDESYQTQLVKMTERFNNTFKVIPTIEERIDTLETLIQISQASDHIATQIRNLTTSSTHKFLAEDEDATISNVVDEQRTVINKMNDYQAELNDLNKQLANNRAYVQAKLPVVIIEKINDAQETLKRCLNEELDRMHSLLQVQRTEEEKKTKIGTINANIQQIENVLDLEPTNSKLFSHDEFNKDSRPKSVQEERYNIDDIDASEYIRRLEMCKNILNYSKQLVNELKASTTSNAASSAANTSSSNSRSPTPLQQDYNELREIEMRLDSYENEIDIKLNEIQENAAKHKKLKEKVDEIDKRLAQIKEKQLLAELNINLDKNTDVDELDAKFNKTRLEYKQITDLNDELLGIDSENKEITKKGDSKRAITPTSINAIKQQNELNEKINKCKSELKQIDVEFASRINELREKLNKQKLNEQQKVFNKFYDSIKIDLLNFDEMKNKLNEELNITNERASKKKREANSANVSVNAEDNNNANNNLLANVLLETTMNTTKDENSDDEGVDDDNHAKKQKLDDDDERRVPFERQGSETRSNDHYVSFSEGEGEDEHAVVPGKSTTPISGRASTGGDEREASFHSVENMLDEVDNKFNPASVIINSNNETFYFDPINVDDNENKLGDFGGDNKDDDGDEETFQIANESSDILIDDIEIQPNTPRKTRSQTQSDDFEEVVVDYIRDSPKPDDMKPSDFSNIIIKVIDEDNNTYDMEEIEKQQKLENERRLKQLEEEYQQEQKRREEEEERFRKQKEQEELRLKQLEIELEAKRLKMEQEEKERQLKLEKELQEKRLKQAAEEEARRLKIEAELEEKRKKIEQEEKERQLKLEKELEEKRLKQEAEEKERLRKLDEEFQLKRRQQEEQEILRLKKLDEELELKRKQQEEQEMARLRKLDEELQLKRQQQEAEEKERLRKLDEELQFKRKKQEEEEKEHLRKLELELEQKRLQQEEAEKERLRKLDEELQEKRRKLEEEEMKRLQKLEHELQQKMIEQEQHEKEKLRQLETELKEKRLKSEEEEKERQLKLEREFEEKRLKQQKDEEERLRKLEIELEKRKLEIEKEEEERRRQQEIEDENRHKRLLEEEERRRKQLLEEEERWKRQIELEKEEYRKRVEAEEAERKRKFEIERQELIKKQKEEEEALKELKRREEEYRQKLEIEANERRKELERLEKERLLEIERKEKERLKLIEEQEAKIKKQIELEEEERKRKKEQEEKQLKLKLEQEEKERKKIANEINERKKLIQLEEEAERKRREEKLKFDRRIRALCDNLNDVKLKVESFNLNNETLAEQTRELAEHERELNTLNAQLGVLMNEYETSTAFTADSNETLTQFDFVKTFIKFLATQIHDKQKDLSEKESLKLKLNEQDHNLQQYINLAKKLEIEEKNLYLQTIGLNAGDPSTAKSVTTPRGTTTTTGSYVQNLNDLNQKIKSVAVIHSSIKQCLKQINDIHNTNKLHPTEKLHDLNQEKIHENILNPLETHLNNLEKIETQWNLFDNNYNEIKKFLRIDMDYENLLSPSANVTSAHLIENLDNLSVELRKYTKLRQMMNNKLPFITDTLDMGSQLFTQICAPKLNKELNETKDLVSEIKQHLEKKHAKLTSIQKYQDELLRLETNFNAIKNEFYLLETSSLNQSEYELRSNAKQLVELKKKLKLLENEKEKFEQQLSSENERTFNKDIQRLNDFFKNLFKLIEILETKYQNELLKNLPSRNAINELSSWLTERSKQLSVYKNQLAALKKNLNLQELEILQKQLIDLNDEFRGKEHTLKFIQEAMDSEIKQGFYDISLCERYTKLEQDWNYFKSQLHNDLEYIEILFIKLSEFNRDVSEVEGWIGEQQKSEIFSDNFETQLADTKTLLDRIEQSYNKQHQQQQLDQSKYDFNNDKANLENDWNNVVKNFIDKKIDNLKQGLSNLENLNELNEEKNLNKLRQHLISNINEIVMNIKLEVNFLNNGKLLTLQQYENSIEIINTLYEQLEGNENELVNIDTNANRGDYFNISDTKRVISEILNHAKYSIIPIWAKYNELFKEIEFSFNNTHSYIVKADAELSRLATLSFKIPSRASFDLHNTAIESSSVLFNDLTLVSDDFNTQQIGSNVIDIESESDNFDDIEPNEQNNHGLEEFLKKIDLKAQFELCKEFERQSKYLIENLTNLNTKQQLVNSIDNINEQHTNLCNLVQNLHTRYEEIKYEKEFYKNLIKSTLNLIKQSYNILNFDDKDLSLSKDFNKIKNILNLIKDNELNLKLNLNKFKQLNLNHTITIESTGSLFASSSGGTMSSGSTTGTLIGSVQPIRRIHKLIDLINESDSVIRNLNLKEKNLLERLNESRLRMQSKINEINLYLIMYENKYKDDLKSLDINRFKLSLDPLLEIFSYMLDNFKKLSDYKSQLEAYLIETANQFDDDDSANNSEINEIKNLLDKINLFLNQLNLMQTCGFIKDFHELNDIVKKLFNYEASKSVIPTSLSGKDFIDDEKTLQLKILFSRFTDLKRSILHQLDNLTFIDRLQIQQIIEKLELKLNEVLRDSESIIDKLNKYRLLALQTEKDLIETEEKLLRYETENQKYDDYNNLEDQFNYYSKLKNFLQENELKFNLELLHSIGSELDRYRKYGNMITATNIFLNNTMKVSTTNLDLLKTLEYLPNYEALRIKYLDLQYRLDMKLKQLESEFTNWKFIAKKSSRLLDIMKNYHQLLASSTIFHNDGDESNEKFASKNDILRTIQVLKQDILNNLNDNECLKSEIITLSKKSTIKSRLINEIITKIIAEWNLLNEQINNKIIKYEALYRKLNNVDLNLLNLRQEIVILEIYLNRDCLLNVNLNNYKEIMLKQCELNDLLERLNRQDESIVNLLRYCEVNTRNQALIVNLSERWFNVKLMVKEKLLELQNLWLLICDLNEQIEKFALIVTKTENFYYNTLLTINETSHNVLKFIENLYQTIKDDDKLLKYLNQSYININKLTTKFVLFHKQETFKQKILFINSKWDDLHNEIAIKIKSTRKKENVYSTYKISKDTFFLWLNEIDLLITNLEYLSTKELQLKYNDIQDLKREVCEQSEKLFKSEKHFYTNETFNSLVERLKDLLNRLTRLDSFVTASMTETEQQQQQQTQSNLLFSGSKLLPGQSSQTLNPNNSAYAFFRRALPSIS